MIKAFFAPVCGAGRVIGRLSMFAGNQDGMKNIAHKLVTHRLNAPLLFSSDHRGLTDTDIARYNQGHS